MGLLLAPLRVPSCRPSVNADRMACDSAKKMYMDIYDETYSGTWTVSAGETTAVDCASTLG